MSDLDFTEEMKGWITLGASDFAQGAEQGKRDGTFLMFHLTITAPDVTRFVADPMHEGTAVGYVECEALGGRRPVEKGVFNLFVDSDDPTRTRMLYRLFFTDADSEPLTFTGFKNVKDEPGFDVWSDTSTLYVRVLRGHVTSDDHDSAEVVASGIITIYLLDFAKQLTTFRVHGGDAKERLAALAAFGKLFLGKLWDHYRRQVEDAVS